MSPSFIREKALSLGATDFGISKVKGKRYYVIYKKKKINFGSDVGKTFIDHGDTKKRKNWKARHSKIRLKDGRLAYKVKESPAFWSRALLWT
jgi:hypothetical protein